MSSFQIFIIIAYFAVIQIVHPSPSDRQLFLSQQESNGFLDKRQDSESQEEEATPPTTTPSPTTSCTLSPSQKLCHGTTQNHVIDIGCGKKVVCKVPSEEELIEELNELGGYNHHYVALTLKEAEENFDNLLEPYIGKKSKRHHGKGRGKKYGHNRKGHPHYKSHSGHKTYKRSQSCETPTCLQAGGDNSNVKLMCPICNRCRKLPDDVFPRYVNEITCDNSTSGYSAASPPQCVYDKHKFAKCRQRNITIDVLTKNGEDYEVVHSNGTTTIYKQVWSSKTEEIRICCECVG